MEQRQLPEGWTWVPLTRIVTDTSRRDPGTQPEKPFRYVEISSVDNQVGAVKLDEVRSLKGSEAPSRARKVIRTDDVLLATTRPYLKNIAMVPDALDDEICSTGFCVIRARESITSPRYIYYACRSDFFIEQLILKQRGANYPAVTHGDVYESLLPLPYPDDPARSLETQRRIVARIEVLFADLRAARELHQKVVEDTGRLMEAVLAEVFPDPSCDASGSWLLKSIEDISKSPQYGYTQSACSEPVGPKFLRITDIQNGQVDWSSVPYCECSDADFQKYKLNDGDIVFARSGATTGKTFLVKNPPEAVFASYLIRLQIERDTTLTMAH